MCLIKLRLTLTNYDYETRTSAHDATNPQGNVAKSLAGATYLEQLQLYFRLEDLQQFENILGSCRFSKLKLLILSGMKSTD